MADFDWYAGRSDLAGLAQLDSDGLEIDHVAVRGYRLARVRSGMVDGVDCFIGAEARLA